MVIAQEMSFFLRQGFSKLWKKGFKDRVHRSLISEQGLTAGAQPQLWAALMVYQEVYQFGDNKPRGRLQD